MLASGCDLDVPDLNNPGIGDLTDNPTVSSVTAAATGLIIGNRRNHAAANGYVAQLGILGREAYNFDQADPRFVGELLQGSLNAGSPFGGNFWTLPYANIRLANTLLPAIDKVPELSDAEKAGLRAEARFFTGDPNGAMADLNLVRTVSGGLAQIGGGAPSEDVFVTALLYERRYSLLFEGHRWIDVRRFDRLDTLPLDKPEHTRNRRYPIPLAECNARPGEPACALDSL